ncbi:MAG: DUF4097 family beta strand repeat-containing protein, partial [Elusimicrobia bacterium]|nr:DUF4097 family beta strand repeat-containing protein [Elusimicrobiota bacterium]
MKSASLGLSLLTGLALLARPSAALRVELPASDIYVGTGAANCLKVRMGDSDLRVVPGREKLRITMRPRADGAGSREFLEAQARQVTVRFDPASGRLEVVAPRQVFGSVNANVEVEAPGRFCAEIASDDGDVAVSRAAIHSLSVVTGDGDVELEDAPGAGDLRVRTQDGDVAMSRMTVGEFSVATRDGDVELDEVSNAGTSRVSTRDGNVDLRGSPGQLGRITTSITGGGRLFQSG